MSVLIVGSVALDTIKTPFGKAIEILGGSGTYSSISARVFTDAINLVAVVGEDFPSKHISFLKKKGIDLKGLVVKKGKTFRWEGEYGWDFADAKTIATHLNVFADFDPVIPKDYRNSDYLFLANIDPDLQNRVLSQVARPKAIICDTMNYWIANKRKSLLRLLKKVDIMLLNESEARQLTGETSLVKSARALRKCGAKKVIIKKGEHGSLLFSENSIFSTPAYLLESVYDPTGAGDTFAGGLIGYLDKKKACGGSDLRKAVVYGNVMATFAVEDFSLRRLGAVKRNEVEKRLKQFKKLTDF